MAAFGTLGSYETSSLSSGSSPSKRKEQSTFGDRTTIRPAKEVQQEIEIELRHQWVGSMPFEEFLPIQNLRGISDVPKIYFRAVPQEKELKESDIYDFVVSNTLQRFPLLRYINDNFSLD